MSLGERIYKLRTEKEMSQGDLADALEVSRQSISKWETNGSVPELDKLIKLSEIFGISLDELVTGKTRRTGSSNSPTDRAQDCLCRKAHHADHKCCPNPRHYPHTGLAAVLCCV